MRDRFGRKARYRKARFDNRTRKPGWLAPSLRHRVEADAAYARKLRARLPAATAAVESCRFYTAANSFEAAMEAAETAYRIANDLRNDTPEP